MDRSEVTRFLKSAFFVLLIVFLLDRSIGSCLKYLYQSQRSGYLYRSNYAIDSTTSDYLVIGSSRANHHYDSRVFEEELHASFYNCGRDGQNVIYSSALASAITTRYKPRLIIIDIRPNEFTFQDEDVLSSLLPYHENQAIKPYLRCYSKFENVKLLSRIYPYNSLLTSLIAGVSAKNKRRAEDYRGYIRLDGTLQNGNLKEFTESGPADSMKIDVLRNLLTRLNNLQVPTFVVISPLYSKYENTTTARISSDLSAPFSSVRFLNFASNPEFKDRRYFKDETHLNDEGAKLFSEEMAKSIRSYQNRHAGPLRDLTQ